MSKDNLKVSVGCVLGFGKRLNLASYIRIITWTGMIMSSAVFILALNILVLPSALNLSIEKLIGKISFELALVILPVGIESDFLFRTIDTTSVVYAMMATLALLSIGWFIYNFYLRKLNLTCNDWKSVEDFLNKRTTVTILIVNILNLTSIAVTEILNIDWLVNKMLSSSVNVTFIWITLSILNSIFSSILVYGIRRRKAHLIKIYLQWANSLLIICWLAILFFSGLLAITFKMPWIVALTIPLINISILLFVQYVGNVVILYTIILRERNVASEMRVYVSAQPYQARHGAQSLAETSIDQQESETGFGESRRVNGISGGRRIRNTIRIVDDASNDSEVVTEIARAIDSFT